MITIISAEVKTDAETFQPELHFTASLPLVPHGSNTAETQGLSESEIYEKLGRELVKKSFAMAKEKSK